MSLEITRTKGEYTYRVNPYAPTELDRKHNRHRARWQRFSVHDSAEEAMTALLGMERDSGVQEDTGAA